MFFYELKYKLFTLIFVCMSIYFRFTTQVPSDEGFLHEVWFTSTVSSEVPVGRRVTHRDFRLKTPPPRMFMEVFL